MRYILLSSLFAFLLLNPTQSEAKRKRPASKAERVKYKEPINDIGAWPIGDIVPEYTELARRNLIEGEILASVLIDKFGKPKKMKFERSSIRVQEASVQKALFNARYNPAVKDGEPVECWWTYLFVFKMSEEEKARMKKWKADHH
jgi:outer membrane biosynthesis protein TonB